MPEFTSRQLDFLLIGVPRAGTTSLFHYLRGHPSIYIPIEKEAPFFSDPDWLDRGWDAFFADFYRSAPPQAVLGKMTPQYWGHLDVMQRVAEMMPGVKLLVVFRNPVDRAYSHYTLSFRENDLAAEPFEDAIEHNGEYLGMSEYGRWMETLLERFPAEQVKTFFTEDLERRPTEVLDEVLVFLGLEPGYRPANLGKVYNRGGTRRRFPWLAPLVKGNPVTRLMWQALPRRGRRVMKLLYNSEFATRRAENAGLSGEMRGRLVQHFRDDVRRLEAILGRNVPWDEFRVEAS